MSRPEKLSREQSKLWDPMNHQDVIRALGEGTTTSEYTCKHFDMILRYCQIRKKVINCRGQAFANGVSCGVEHEPK